MRTVVVKDTKIPKDELLAMLDDYSDFMEEHTGIKPVFWVEQRDFSSVPTKVDDDGDMKPTNDYLKALSKDVESRYGEAGTDNVVMLVHEDNFLYRGIWGQNWSFSLGSYSLQLCRWDRDNVVNSFGTLYHEQSHSFDAVVKKETGIDINKTLGFDWDRQVHGKDGWDYIGRISGRENTKALKQVAPYLKKAYKVREERHMKKIGLMEQIVKIVSTLISLLQKKK